MLRMGRHNVIPSIMGVQSFAPRSAAAAGNGLLNALIAYWPGDEESGALLDAHTNGLDLTDTNTVTYAAGKVYDNARQYTAANSEYHTIADNASLSAGDNDFTIAAWVYLDSLGVIRAIASKHATVNQLEYILYYRHSTTNFSFLVSSDGNTTGYVIRQATSFGLPNTSTWYFVVGWHDAGNNTVNIQINNGTVDSTAHSAGVYDGTDPFMVGNYGGATSYMNGRIGPVMFWKSSAGNGGVLTADQRTALYNSGNGLAYASFTS